MPRRRRWPPLGRWRSRSPTASRRWRSSPRIVRWCGACAPCSSGCISTSSMRPVGRWPPRARARMRRRRCAQRGLPHVSDDVLDWLKADLGEHVADELATLEKLWRGARVQDAGLRARADALWLSERARLDSFARPRQRPLARWLRAFDDVAVWRRALDGLARRRGRGAVAPRVAPERARPRRWRVAGCDDDDVEPRGIHRIGSMPPWRKRPSCRRPASRPHAWSSRRCRA